MQTYSHSPAVRASGWPIMLISSSICLFWDSTRVALHDSQFKKILIYPVLALYATPQFTLCLKHFALRLPLLIANLLDKLQQVIGQTSRSLSKGSTHGSENDISTESFSFQCAWRNSKQGHWTWSGYASLITVKKTQLYSLLWNWIIFYSLLDRRLVSSVSHVASYLR